MDFAANVHLSIQEVASTIDRVAVSISSTLEEERTTSILLRLSKEPILVRSYDGEETESQPSPPLQSSSTSYSAYQDRGENWRPFWNASHRWRRCRHQCPLKYQRAHPQLATYRMTKVTRPRPNPQESPKSYAPLKEREEDWTPHAYGQRHLQAP